jgi:FAD synthetase
MVFGTFDILHKGHLYFLKNAKRYGDELIVVIARDKTVKDVKNKLPLHKERKRLEDVKKVKYVCKAILGNLNNKYKIIRQIKPDVICLGYDQKYFIDGLKKFKKIKIIRLKPYKEYIYKSSKIREKFIKS